MELNEQKFRSLDSNAFVGRYAVDINVVLWSHYGASELLWSVWFILLYQSFPNKISPCMLQGDVWLCMEVMDTSLDKFYKMVYDNDAKIPEDILGKIALAVSTCLW